MSRIPLPFQADDLSALARSLKGQIETLDHKPGHVELLNMLARAGGWRNFQHFRAQAAACAAVVAPRPSTVAAEPVDYVKVKRLARHFDAAGRLLRWPGKHNERLTCLWVLWSSLPSRRVLGEPEVNTWLQVVHTFGDHALLRRELCDQGMMTRTPDGREYRRVEQRPPAEALALIDLLKRRQIPTVATCVGSVETD